MSNDGIGVAVIGAGMAGKAHAAGYRSASTVYGPGLPEVRLMAIADVNEELGAETARRFGYQRSEQSWEAVAEADDIDVVSVVVANPLHREIVESLLAAGKHVLCEKPLAPTVADAEAMVASADRAGVQACVGFTFRRAPAIAAVREILESGAIGRPLHFDGHYWCDYGVSADGPMSWRYKGPAGSGALADIGSHIVDVAEFLCGPVRSTRGALLTTMIEERALPIGAVAGHATAELSDVREPVENEDQATFALRLSSGGLSSGGLSSGGLSSGGLDSGATANIAVSRIAFGRANSLGFQVFAERGAVAFELDRPGELQVADTLTAGPTHGYRTVPIGPMHPYLTGGLPMDFPGVGFGQNDLFTFQARAFLEQVSGLDGLPPCPPMSVGLHNLRVLQAVVESAESAGREVLLDEPPASSADVGSANGQLEGTLA